MTFTQVFNYISLLLIFINKIMQIFNRYNRASLFDQGHHRQCHVNAHVHLREDSRQARSQCQTGHGF